MQRQSEQRKGLKTVAVLLAAGKSERFGSNKLTETLHGRPVWLSSFSTLSASPKIDGVGIVASGDLIEECRSMASQALFVVQGGATRTQSSRIGFEHLPDWAEAVLFHDAARPFVTQELVSRIVDAIDEHGAAFPSLQLSDTVKQESDDGFVTLERSRLLRVQTPQGGLVSHFRKAFAVGNEATDDMALLEAVGVRAVAVPGEESNRKLTVRSDLNMGEVRTGIGYDVHRFSTDPMRPLMLGGVHFEGAGPGLEGHSDADALLHSVVDALLGAAGLGDIGERYPNSDPRWKDAPSVLFLEECAKALGDEGWRVVNIDVSVLAERPKIGPFKELIRQRIAEAIGIEPTRVAVKATTNEGLGSIGRGEGIASFAVATVERQS